MSSLSFVLPAFDEAENVAEAVARCVLVGERLGLTFEIIVVDDGSRDATLRIVDALAARDPRVRAVHHPRNRGYGAALRSGLAASRMERVFFTDADLQFDVGEVAGLLSLAARFDVVAGYRAPRRDPIGRRLLGWGWSRLVGLLFTLDVRDVDCAFKVMNRRVIEQVALRSRGALVNTELLVRARAEGFSLTQVPVTHYPRTAGKQGGASPRVVLRALTELVALHGDLRASTRQARRAGVLRSG